MSDEHIHPGNPADGYDHHDAKTGIIAMWSIGVIIFVILSVLVMLWLSTIAEQKEYNELVAKRYWEDTLKIRARDAEYLNHYGFIDKQKGVVRLPIARAMELLEAQYKEGKVGYNTKPYPVKAEPLGGAAATAAAAPAPTTPNAAAEAHK